MSFRAVLYHAVITTPIKLEAFRYGVSQAVQKRTAKCKTR